MAKFEAGKIYGKCTTELSGSSKIQKKVLRKFGKNFEEMMKFEKVLGEQKILFIFSRSTDINNPDTLSLKLRSSCYILCSGFKRVLGTFQRN